MVRIARQDTYGVEDLGAGVRVRRRIIAGTEVPAHYEVEGGAVEERSGPARPRRTIGPTSGREGVRPAAPAVEATPGVEPPAEPAPAPPPAPAAPRRGRRPPVRPGEASS